MSGTTIDSDELRRLADRIERLADEYQYLYRHKLYGEVLSDIRRAYKGVDADAMINGLEQFRYDFNRLKHVIDQYVCYLRRAARRYDEVQEELEQSADLLSSDADSFGGGSGGGCR